jgi:hypothetical protein
VILVVRIRIPEHATADEIAATLREVFAHANTNPDGLTVEVVLEPEA